jgi:hypothetical protein
MTFHEEEPVAILDKSGHLKGEIKGVISTSASPPIVSLED